MNKTKLRPFGVIEKPREGEYPDYAHIYVDLLPDDGLILKHLANNLNTPGSRSPSRRKHWLVLLMAPFRIAGRRNMFAG